MSPHMDALLFSKKGKKKILSLTLSEGEEVLASIKEAMKQHKLDECKVEDMSGTMKDGYINYFEGSHYKTMRLNNKPILRATGNFKLNFDELWGSMQVSTAERKPANGTLVSGVAAEGLEVKLSFIEILD